MSAIVSNRQFAVVGQATTAFFRGAKTMSSNRRNGFQLSKNIYHARFEPLESRRCLSGSAMMPFKPNVSTTPPPATITTQGHSLTVRDTEAGDTITVTDDGAGDVNVIIANSTGGSVASGSGTGIHNVTINASGGGDTVDYTLGASSISISATSAVRRTPSAAATSTESIEINLGKGNNTANFTDSAGLTSSNLFLDVDASGGGNSMTESFGALTSAKLFSSFAGFGGSDTLAASLTGNLTTSQAYFSAFGGGGSNKLGVTVSGDIAADSLLSAQLSGGWKGGDNIDFSYMGMLDGKLFAGTTGAGGNETITQSITANNGSTGSLHSFIAAGRGSAANDLTLNLTDDSGGSATAASTLKSVDAVILDQPGDTPTLTVSANDTADVTVITQKAHGWFWGWLGFGWGW